MPLEKKAAKHNPATARGLTNAAATVLKSNAGNFKSKRTIRGAVSTPMVKNCIAETRMGSTRFANLSMTRMWNEKASAQSNETPSEISSEKPSLMQSR